MKAIRMYELGGSEKLLYEDAPKPIPQSGEILVRVKAVSLNCADLPTAHGEGKFAMTPPWTPGCDMAGIVESTGDGCNSFRAGDEIYAKCTGGSYAEYMALDSSFAAKKPANMDFAEAAALAGDGLAAHQALFAHGRLKKGQKLFIHGDGGDIANIAVQLAKNAGAFVCASLPKSDFDCAKFLGADSLIDLKSATMPESAKDMDMALLLSECDAQEAIYGLLKKGGTLVSVGFRIDAEKARLRKFKAKSATIVPDGDALAQLALLAEEGRLKTDTAFQYPLAQAREAWEVFLGARPAPKGFGRGKIILSV